MNYSCYILAFLLVILYVDVTEAQWGMGMPYGGYGGMGYGGMGYGGMGGYGGGWRRRMMMGGMMNPYMGMMYGKK